MLRRVTIVCFALSLSLVRMFGADESLANSTIVVFNADAPGSAALAKFYAQKRGIPHDHLIALHCAVDEEIGRGQYDTTIAEPLRATLRMLRKIAREHSVTADDMREVLAAGASRAQIEDALAVAFAFDTITRLANTFGFSVPDSKAFQAGAKFLLARGYR